MTSVLVAGSVGVGVRVAVRVGVGVIEIDVVGVASGEVTSPSSAPAIGSAGGLNASCADDVAFGATRCAGSGVSAGLGAATQPHGHEHQQYDTLHIVES